MDRTATAAPCLACARYESGQRDDDATGKHSCGLPAGARRAGYATLDAVRDGLLDGIARGVERIDRERGEPGDPHPEPRLWRVEVALLDSDRDTLRVAPLSEVLSWVVGRQRLCLAANDTCLDAAISAHVFLHEERCAEPGCKSGEHRDPTEAEDAAEDEDDEPATD